MSIKVRYFASLKEKVGRSDDEFQPTGPVSVQDIWQQLNPKLPIPDTLLAAIDMEYVSLDAKVADGCELAFFPPVTGG